MSNSKTQTETPMDASDFDIADIIADGAQFLPTLPSFVAATSPGVAALPMPESPIRSDAPATLSRGARQRILEDHFLALYRWYVAQSQRKRAWNPDFDFDWRQFKTEHSADVWAVIEGFFAVEQYVPDYASKITQLVRRSAGRSYFQLQWGAEEAKHSLVWENALIFSRHRSVLWIEDYRHDLMENEWNLPWDDPLHLLAYTVFQERATQLNYWNLGALARGARDYPVVDPVLERVCRVLVADEAAHYHFFLEGLRLSLYYFPSETLEAILDVLKHFAMPAQNIIPDWNRIAEAIYRLGLYGPRDFRSKVIGVVFDNLGLKDRKSIEKGLHASRVVPDAERIPRDSAIWQSFHPARIEAKVRQLTAKIQKYERLVGRDSVAPFCFVPNPDWPATSQEETTEI